MLVAIRDFICRDHLGIQRTFRRGQTRVSEWSEYARDYPENFAVDESDMTRLALVERFLDFAPDTMTSRAVSPSSEMRPAIDLRSMPSAPVVVWMLREMRRKIAELAGESRDGNEAGGFLIGRAHERTIEVVDVVSAAVRRGPARTWLDGWTAEQSVPPGLAIVGSWHTHLADNATPSDLDLETWRDYFTGPFPVCRAGVIVCPDLGDGWPWAYPHMHAWMLRRHRKAGVVVEPAAIELSYISTSLVGGAVRR